MASANELPLELVEAEANLLRYELARARITPEALPRLSEAPGDSDVLGVDFSAAPDDETRRIAWDVLVSAIVHKGKPDPIGWTEAVRDGRHCIDLHWPRAA